MIYYVNDKLELSDDQYVVDKSIILYIPTYNCKNYIRKLITNIPKSLHGVIECVIVDNCSVDGSIEVIKEIIFSKIVSFKITLFVMPYNVGYSGSQKFAYNLFLQLNIKAKIIVLHGDGQYLPELLLKFIPHFYEDVAIVYGYRSKKLYPYLDERYVFSNDTG